MSRIEVRWHSKPMRASYERRLAALETSYRELLLSALQRCAEGRWGLFAQNEPILDQLPAGTRQRFGDPAVKELLELGSEIERLRRKSGLESFSLHEQLVRIRASHHANSLGEPKLAQQWLDELNKSGHWTIRSKIGL